MKTLVAVQNGGPPRSKGLIRFASRNCDWFMTANRLHGNWKQPMKIHLSVVILREQNKANHQIRATVHLIWPGQYNQAFLKKKSLGRFVATHFSRWQSVGIFVNTWKSSGAAYGGDPQKVFRCWSCWMTFVAKPKSPTFTSRSEAVEAKNTFSAFKSLHTEKNLIVRNVSYTYVAQKEKCKSLGYNWKMGCGCSFWLVCNPEDNAREAMGIGYARQWQCQICGGQQMFLSSLTCEWRSFDACSLWRMQFGQK